MWDETVATLIDVNNAQVLMDVGQPVNFILTKVLVDIWWVVQNQHSYIRISLYAF